MKRHFFFLALILSVFTAGVYAQNGKNENPAQAKFETKQMRISGASITYQMREGRIEGLYKSWYTNGEMKAEGTFVSNHRLGKWTVWDSTGKMRVQRIYKNQFYFSQVVPKVPDNPPITLLNVSRYVLEYNKKGFIDNFNVTESMVVWSKRLWRFIPEKNNPLIFTNNHLMNVLMKNLAAGYITAYTISDDEFTDVLPTAEISTKSKRVIGYKLKEDCFFDKERFVSESRIIGLCPVAYDSTGKDTVGLFWLYYPELRKTLTKDKFKNIQNIPENVKQMDDLFFFRYFSSTIYKEANPKNRAIADYKKGSEIQKESEKIELGIIEAEHNFWISLAP